MYSQIDMFNSYIYLFMYYIELIYKAANIKQKVKIYFYLSTVITNLIYIYLKIICLTYMTYYLCFSSRSKFEIGSVYMRLCVFKSTNFDELKILIRNMLSKNIILNL